MVNDPSLRTKVKALRLQQAVLARGVVEVTYSPHDARTCGSLRLCWLRFRLDDFVQAGPVVFAVTGGDRPVVVGLDCGRQGKINSSGSASCPATHGATSTD